MKILKELIKLFSEYDMKVNPLNVLNLLIAYFQGLYIEETPYNIKEYEIYDHFKIILSWNQLIH